MVLPFGTGKRTCPGKRFVELELLIFLKKIVNVFEIEYISDFDVQFEFILTAKSPVKIKFKDRWISPVKITNINDIIKLRNTNYIILKIHSWLLKIHIKD